jgi:hypothetical protein
MKKEFSKPVAALVVVLGVISAVAQILSAPLWIKAIAAVITAGCVAWGILRIYGHSSYAPPVFESYEIVPATEEQVRWAAGLAQRVYKGDDVIPEALMLDWYRANKDGFFVIRNIESGDLVGNLDILPLKPCMLKRLIAGKLLEREIIGDCIFSPPEKEQITSVYVESFVAVIDESQQWWRVRKWRPNQLAAKDTMLDFVKILENICDPLQVKEVYALAASKYGDKIVRHLGFRLRSGADQRRDGHNLYVALTRDFAIKMLKSEKRVKQIAKVRRIASSNAD